MVNSEHHKREIAVTEILHEVEGTTQDGSSTELLCGEAEGCG